MKKSDKILLVIGLLVFILVKLIGILNEFDIKEFKKILDLRYISIPIITIFLLICSSNKGNGVLCKIGFFFLFVYITVDALVLLDVVKYDYKADNTIYNILQTINTVSFGGLDLCGMLALCSLLPTNNYNILKRITFVGYAIYLIITSLNYSINFSKMKIDWVTKIGYAFGSVALISFALFISLYLLNKEKIDQEKKMDDEDDKILEQVALNQQIIHQQQVAKVNQVSQQQQIMQQQVAQVNQASQQQQIMQQQVAQVNQALPNQVDTLPTVQQPVVNESNNQLSNNS